MVIVTGGLGFIGSNLVEQLYNRGEQDIMVVDRLRQPIFRYFPATYVKKYLSTEAFLESMEDYKYANRIYHMGAISDTTERDESKIQYYNISFSKRLITFCIGNNIPLTYASSASVYGNSRLFKEDIPLQPASPYAHSKAVIDQFIEEQLDRYSRAEIQSLRFFNVYGQYEDHKANQSSPVSKFIKEARQTNTIKIFEGSEGFFRDFIHVNDVISIMFRLASSGAKGIFNVGTGNVVSFLQVARCIAEYFNAQIRTIPFPGELTGQYQEYTRADLSKISTFTTGYQYARIEDYLKQLFSSTP